MKAIIVGVRKLGKKLKGLSMNVDASKATIIASVEVVIAMLKNVELRLI